MDKSKSRKEDKVPSFDNELFRAEKCQAWKFLVYLIIKKTSIFPIHSYA